MDNNRLLAIHILEILNEHSNRNNKITQKEISYYLENNYGETVSRRTLSTYVQQLKQEGYVEGSRGIYRVDIFSEREIRTLIDGVMYGKHIPKDQADILITKLKMLSLNTMKDKAKNITYLSGINRTTNKNLYQILDVIDDAISRQLMIEITQFSSLPEGKESIWSPKIVDPYFVVADQSRYYLLCHGDREGLEPRRIDRIKDIRIVYRKRKPLAEVAGDDFDLGKYMREHVYMFSGKVERVTIKIMTKNIGYYEDWFGSKYYILDSNDEYTVLACDTNVNAVYYWALQYGNIAKVLEPVELRKRIIRGLKDILKGYE